MTRNKSFPLVDSFVKSGKSLVLPFRSLRKLYEMIEKFLVAALIKMTQNDFLRIHL